LDWLDGWIDRHGPRANSLAHFSWHAAIHELALDDGAAVRRRYREQLAPPIVNGPRALVDSGTLLWKCRMSAPEIDHVEAATRAGSDETSGTAVPDSFNSDAGPSFGGPPPAQTSASDSRPAPAPTPIATVAASWAGTAATADFSADFWFDPNKALAVLDAAPEEWLRRPASPFATMHAAIALALAQDAPSLAALAAYARRHTHRSIREVAAPLAEGLLAAIERRWDTAIAQLKVVVPRSAELQGSAAQMEIIEDTLLHVLVEAGRTAEAAELLSRRLDRHTSPHEQRRLRAIADLRREQGGASAGTPSAL
jgi:hypothetical protein